MQSQVRFSRVWQKVLEKVWETLVRGRSGSTGLRRRFRRRFQEALVQGQVSFSRVLEKVPEKVPGGFVQRQVRFNRVLEKVPEKVWEALEQAEVFPALGFAARFRNICKNETLRLLGIPPKLIGS